MQYAPALLAASCLVAYNVRCTFVRMQQQAHGNTQLKVVVRSISFHAKPTIILAQWRFASSFAIKINIHNRPVASGRLPTEMIDFLPRWKMCIASLSTSHNRFASHLGNTKTHNCTMCVTHSMYKSICFLRTEDRDPPLWLDRSSSHRCDYYLPLLIGYVWIAIVPICVCVCVFVCAPFRESMNYYCENNPWEEDQSSSSSSLCATWLMIDQLSVAILLIEKKNMASHISHIIAQVECAALKQQTIAVMAKPNKIPDPCLLFSEAKIILYKKREKKATHRTDLCPIGLAIWPIADCISPVDRIGTTTNTHHTQANGLNGFSCAHASWPLAAMRHHYCCRLVAVVASYTFFHSHI